MEGKENMKLKAAAQPGRPIITTDARSITAEFAIDDKADMNAQVIEAKALMYSLLERPGVNYVNGLFRIAGMAETVHMIRLRK